MVGVKVTEKERKRYHQQVLTLSLAKDDRTVMRLKRWFHNFARLLTGRPMILVSTVRDMAESFLPIYTYAYAPSMRFQPGKHILPVYSLSLDIGMIL